MRKEEALRLLGVDVDAWPFLTGAQLRRQYLQRALVTHPDKNQEDSGAGHQFSQLKEAYDLLISGSCGVEDVRQERQQTSTLLALLQRALKGENVEDDLRRLGVHRPSAMFGIDLAVPFDRRSGSAGGGARREDIRQAFTEAFRDSGLDEEGNPLEGWPAPAADE